MAKWKIWEKGQNYDLQAIELEVNPSSYSRMKHVDAVYEQLLDGSHCRVVSPNKFVKEEIQVVWASVKKEQLDALMVFIDHNNPVNIQDHLIVDNPTHPVSFTAYIDGVEIQYLISGTDEQRYAVSMKLREV